MEPITTTVAISTVVGYLAKKLKDNKSVQGFFDDFTEATVNWIKPIFITKDGEPKEVLTDLQEQPDNPAMQNAAKSSLEVAIAKNPHSELLLREMLKVIQQKEPMLAKKNSISIVGDGNKT